jgi:hypothetical protein
MLLIFSIIHDLSIHSFTQSALLCSLTSVLKNLIKQLSGRIAHFKINT